MSDRITYCDVVECCAECPRYGDDCDGDKRNDDLISRADAIEAVCGVVIDEFDVSPTRGYEVAEKALSALPSAEPSIKAIKRQIDEHWYLDPPSAEAVQGWIPCSERLPDTDISVLVSDGVYVWEDELQEDYEDGKTVYWWDSQCSFDFNDTAWMPKPKPYKGGENK